MEVLWRCCGGAVGACAPCALGCALPPPAPPTPSSARGVSAAALLSARRAQPRAGRGGRAGRARSPVGGRRPRGAPRPPPRRRLGGAWVGALGRWGGRGCPVRRSERWREGWATECPQVNRTNPRDPPGGMKPFFFFVGVLGYRSAKNSCRPRTATPVPFAPACRRRFLRPAASLPGPQTACQNQGCKSVAVCPTPRRRGAQKAGSSVHPARNDRIASIPSRGAAPRERSTGGGWGGTTFPHFKTRQSECQRSVSGG